jgi:hypothetical protein
LVGSLIIPVSGQAYAADEDALDSVARIAPEVLANVADSHDTQVVNGELQVDTDSADAAVPLNSAKPIRLSEAGKELKVGLPFSDQKTKGHRGVNEPVQFDNENGTSTIPVIKDDGSVQITTVIESAESPQNFQYEIELPAGFSMHSNPDGGITFVDAEGKPTGGVAAPWAKDSQGTAIPTTYEISGSTLTQIVQHKSQGGVAYPVVADPWLGFSLIAAVWVNGNTSSWTVNIAPTSWGRQNAQPYTHFAHVDELRTLLNATGHGWALNYTIEQQFLCHVAGNTFEPGTYNLESWRPGLPWITQLNLQYRCNP